jgi:hypothetical protein
MTDSIAGLPFWEITFDEQGDPDGSGNPQAIKEIADKKLTDVVLFSHGWNNNHSVAMSLYQGWFAQLAPQLAHAKGPVAVGLVGIFWPSQRWSDEPIPDFAPSPGGGAAPGAASLGTSATYENSASLDPAELKSLQSAFPKAKAALARMAVLLDGEPSDAALGEFQQLLSTLATASGDDGDDGGTSDRPRMLADDPLTLFGRFSAALVDSGAVFTGDEADGAAGLGDTLKGIWNGAKEALRQTTYFEMKNRAGTVGRMGLGPFIMHLSAAVPGVRVHLVGHSFGARVVSYALAGVSASPKPIKSVTLLQGAFSHFAFADPLPFDASRKGGLAGLQSRIDGPLTVVFSSHDDAVGRFYPLASITSGDDAAGLGDHLYRWGGMGHDGAQGVGALLDSIQPANSSTSYRLQDGHVLNVDASEVVCQGSSPSGAHSDIVHPEITWLTLQAAKIL